MRRNLSTQLHWPLYSSQRRSFCHLPFHPDQFNFVVFSDSTMLLHRPDTHAVHPASRCCCTDQTRKWFTLSHDAAAPIRHPSGSPASRGCFAGQITLLNSLTSILSHNAASPINIPCSASLLPSCLTMLFHRCFCTSLSTSRCLSSWRSPATAFVTARE